VAAADLNGDGHADLVVANRNSATVSVLLGNGDGTFAAAHAYSVGTSPRAVAVADVNGDGRPDVIVANLNSYTVSVLLNNGNGTFATAINSPAGVFPVSLAVTDVNGDGRPDLVVANETYPTGSVSVLLGNGTGTFQSPTSYAAGPLSIAVAAADLNGDGRADLVTANYNGSGSLSVFLNNGNGTFKGARSYSTGSYSAAVTVADVNGDGHPDLISANGGSGTVSVLAGNGDGTFKAAVNFAAGPRPSSVAVADFNGDGRPDLVVANSVSAGSVSVLLGNGNGSFQLPQTVGAGSYAIAAIPADLNGDGSPDLAVVNFGANNVSAFVNNCAPSFSFTNHGALTVGSFPASVVAADLNGDGRQDVVVANYNNGTVSAFLGQGNGSFQASLNSLAGANPTALAVADVNGDGRPDLIVANSLGAGTVSVLLGNGNGTFGMPQPFAVGVYPAAVAVADVNGDGRQDLVVANHASYTVSVLLGNGNGTFHAAQNFATGQDPLSVAVADVTGDGRPDLIVANFIGYSVSVLLGNGNGTFASAVNFSAGVRPVSVAVADVNGDGRPDLFVANDTSLQTFPYSPGGVSVLLGNGNGTFTPAQLFAAGAYPNAVAVADVNGDGRKDLVVANIGSNTVSVLLGNGDGTFQAAQNFAAGPFPIAVAVADFNGDGRPDLAVADNAPSGTATILLNVGPAAVQLQVISPVSVTAGVPSSLTITAVSAINGLISCNYADTVTFSSNDPKFSQPAYTFTMADEGIHSFSLSLETAGTRTITMTDTVNGSLTAMAVISVLPAATSKFVLAAPPSTIAGSSFLFSVTAEDAFGNITNTYTGTVHLTTSDPKGNFNPPNYTFTAADQGVHTFQATLDTAGSQTLTATDTGNSSLTGMTSILVNAANAVSLALTAPASTLVGSSFALTVTALDAFGNIATSYGGTVHFASSDQGPTLPGDYTFMSSDQGVHTFQPTLRTAGSQTITVTDSGNNLSKTVNIFVNSPNPNSDTRNWTGAAGNNNWTNPANWQEGIAPDGGDDLVFPDGAVTFTPFNDFATGATFHSITFSGSGGGYDLGGSAILLVAGLTGNAGSNKVDLGGITLMASLTFDAKSGTLSLSSPINLDSFTLTLDGSAAGSGPDALSGVISGLGAVVKNGASTWQVTGNNSYTGPTTLNAGNLFIDNANSLGASDSASGTMVLAGASLQVAGALTLAEPLIINGAGNATSTGAIAVLDMNGTDTFNGTITLGSDSTLAGIGPKTSVTLGAAVRSNGFNLSIVNIFNFSGNATVSGPLMVQPGTTLSPGVNGMPGTLTTTGNVTFSANTTFQVALDGTVPGSGYSQLIANGSVNLTGSSLGASLGFTPTPGFNFVIISSGNPILGIFNGLPDGSTLIIGGVPFLIHYDNSSSAKAAGTPFGRVVLCPDPMAEVSSLAIAPNSPTAGQPVTLTAFVGLMCPPAAGHPGASGLFGQLPKSADGSLVTFFDNGVAMGTGVVSGGQANFTSGPLLPGLHNFTAAVNGGAPAGSGLTFTVDPTTFTPVINPPLARGESILAAGAGANGGPQVNLYDAKNGSLLFAFFAYDPNFLGGVRVAVGDINGDGVPDYVTAPGPGGGPEIRAFDGATGRLLIDFMAYNPGFSGGVWVAVGDVNGDGFADIITGADSGGGPNVTVFDGRSAAAGISKVLYSFFAYDPNFIGGVRVAAGDVNGDGKADIITGAGPGGGPHVETFDGSDPSKVLDSFFAYDPNFIGGVFVAAGSFDGDGNADIVTGAGPGGGPEVTVFDGTNVSQVLQAYFAYDPNFQGGVRVAVAASGAGGANEVLNGAGPGGGPEVTLVGVSSSVPTFAFFPYDPSFLGGVFVGGR
jgi:autotransporter-associated beta strand protein